MRAMRTEVMKTVVNFCRCYLRCDYPTLGPGGRYKIE